ncbi:uncharacterized protein MONBRDRAFT_31845 [Monosiga brevicollis MX1]|uniref:USP domain-containing protein n=1 Tax=Monosiga brevicollis TaxID=81824 RepID=A9UVS2_MONBE|nr:uncharacterized protein MONBRDRAFT_31845 [Monosiga brevicollis MX1]EDQ90638.1 predicted protein [Monosiga brevicollis MX1]|eukprot:XP_001744689.1 hypothetical protein [Monosiga brevicollis MX1]
MLKLLLATTEPSPLRLEDRRQRQLQFLRGQALDARDFETALQQLVLGYVQGRSDVLALELYLELATKRRPPQLAPEAGTILVNAASERYCRVATALCKAHTLQQQTRGWALLLTLLATFRPEVPRSLVEQLQDAFRQLELSEAGPWTLLSSAISLHPVLFESSHVAQQLEQRLALLGRTHADARHTDPSFVTEVELAAAAITNLHRAQGSLVPFFARVFSSLRDCVPGLSWAATMRRMPQDTVQVLCSQLQQLSQEEFRHTLIESRHRLPGLAIYLAIPECSLAVSSVMATMVFGLVGDEFVMSQLLLALESMQETGHNFTAVEEESWPGPWNNAVQIGPTRRVGAGAVAYVPRASQAPALRNLGNTCYMNAVLQLLALILPSTLTGEGRLAQADLVEDYFCDQCHAKRTASAQTGSRKLMTQVQVPEQVDIGSQTYGYRGAVIHLGEHASTGHYIAHTAIMAHLFDFDTLVTSGPRPTTSVAPPPNGGKRKASKSDVSLSVPNPAEAPAPKREHLAKSTRGRGPGRGRGRHVEVVKGNIEARQADLVALQQRQLARREKWEERQSAESVRQRDPITVKKGPVTWTFPLQPWRGGYGGQGFARASCFFNCRDKGYLEEFTKVWDEYIPNYHGLAFQKARRREMQQQMVWKQQQEEHTPSPSAPKRKGQTVFKTKNKGRTKKAAVTYSLLTPTCEPKERKSWLAVVMPPPKKGAAKDSKKVGYRSRLEAANEDPIPSVELVTREAYRQAQPFKHLVLDGQNLTNPDGTSRLFVTLDETGYPFLTELFFWNLTLSDDDMRAISYFFRAKATVTKLEFLNCKASPDGWDELGESLGVNPAVQSLSCSFCPMTTDGVRRLLLRLCHSRVLRHLALKRCGLEGPVGEFLRDFICRTTLEEVVLDGNPLGLEGFRLLTPVLEFCETLSSLSLDECSIDLVDTQDEQLLNAVLESLGVHLGACACLGTLIMTNNTMSDRAATAFRDALRVRKKAGLRAMKVKLGPRINRDLLKEIQAFGKSGAKKVAKKKGTKKKKK